MDKSTRYQQLIKQSISSYAQLIELALPKTKLDIIPVFDDERGQYLLFETGWTKTSFIRHMPLYITLKNHKIWIEEDMTEEGIATYFLENGVPHEDIVLGFQPPEMRPYTEFAVG
jgi:hypothetical protein